MLRCPRNKNMTEAAPIYKNYFHYIKHQSPALMAQWPWQWEKRPFPRFGWDAAPWSD
jgi:hypothetical protein